MVGGYEFPSGLTDLRMDLQAEMQSAPVTAVAAWVSLEADNMKGLVIQESRIASVLHLFLATFLLGILGLCHCEG